MSTTAKEFIVIDFGIAWTKAFLLVEGEGNEALTIKKRVISPTSMPDLEICFQTILSKFEDVKKADVILTSSFTKKDAVESFTTAPFFESAIIYKDLKDFFARSSYDILFLDGGAGNWLQNYHPEKINSLTTRQITDIEIENYIGNKRNRLFVTPTLEDDLDIEQAYLKNYLITRGLAEGKKNTLVIASGGMLSYHNDTKMVLEILVDNLTLPFCQILLDSQGFLPSFGAYLEFRGKKDLLQVPGLKSLSALINLGAAGQVEMDFGFKEIQKINVGNEELLLIPGEVNHEAVIKSINKQNLGVTLTVGEMGIVVDGRRKPLDLLAKSDTTKEKLRKWRETLREVVV